MGSPVNFLSCDLRSFIIPVPVDDPELLVNSSFICSLIKLLRISSSLFKITPSLTCSVEFQFLSDLHPVVLSLTSSHKASIFSILVSDMSLDDSSVGLSISS